MFSFSRLSVLAALAFGAFTSAAPAVDTSAVTNAASGLSDLPQVLDGGLVRRDQKNVVTIINETTYKVQEYTFEFHYIVAENATFEVIEPIVVNIKGVLGGALTEINGLVGLSTDVILGVEGGLLLTVTEVASAVVGLLTVILEAVSAVLAVVAEDSLECVTALLGSLVEVLGCLVCAILMLVGGLLGGLVSLVVSLLGDLTGVLATLKVTVLISVLGINL